MAKRRKENYGPSPILLWILVLVLIVVIFFLINSSLFNVSSITVYGAERFSAQEIIAASGITYDTNIIYVDEESARQGIEQNAYLRVDDIKRTFPTGVEIYITERTPAAQIATVKGYYVMDEEGIALGLNPLADETLISILNMSITEPQMGSRITAESTEKMEAAAKVLVAVKKYALEGKIQYIDVADPEKIVLGYEGDIIVKIADGDSAEQKLSRLEKTMAAAGDKLVAGNTLNMENEGGYYMSK